MPGFFTDKHKDYSDSSKTTTQVFTGTVKSVSFSTLINFEKCPYSVYLDKISNIGRVGSPAADRGSTIHTLLEEYVEGTLDSFKWKALKSNTFHAPIIENFKKLYKKNKCNTELKIALTTKLKATEWEASNIWLRAIIDIVTWPTKQSAKIFDYKTGSMFSAAQHRSQLMLYAFLIFLIYSKIKIIDVTIIYLDHHENCFYTTYRREDLKLLWPRYLLRLQQITECNDFQPNPNAFSCKWCQHKSIQENLNQTKPACEFAYI